MLPPASALDVKQPFRGPFALLRRALALLGVAGLLGAAAPAGASARVDVSRQQLEARVLAVRSTLAGLDSSRRQADDPARVVAQWLNWPNWNNWNNWPNWYNWGNWFNR